MEPNSIEQTATDLAKIANFRLHAENLAIPILDGFTVEQDENPQVILLATGHGIVEQLVSDGPIKDSKFEDRISLVIENTKQFMRNNNCRDVDQSFIFYKDYNNGTFNFKIYFQDMVLPQQKAIRNIIAYFVEPRMHDFYQFSLSAGPFQMPTELLKLGTIDLDNDQVTSMLSNLMQNLLDSLSYKDAVVETEPETPVAN